ncbi:hypothetical protein [Methylobacterium isbiliense]|jgi:hypothetical protein|uniref:Uncharacterized protein n=1 Tax=Methylobacterium isbiliense TaxID=315478 RepID=A0ABQ4SCB6_9HYPH|nr:hypothetical protein [Methylobacterium isbiliense]MDN3625592.1 hypothetical protein [Methylobacterium isbiliense]GJE00028.1 hypothetical protein GMJLKIPL_1946 [Methylobacterium isbiliense]
MAADLRAVMRFTARRGPGGKMWMEGRHRTRRFVLFEGRDGVWTLFERVGHPAPEQDVQPSRRPAPRRMQRELADLGLIEVGDFIEQAGSVEGGER